MVRYTIENPPPEALALAFLKARLSNTRKVICCNAGNLPRDIFNCPGNRLFDQLARMLRPTYQHHLTTKEQQGDIRNQFTDRFQFVVWKGWAQSYAPFYRESEQKTRRFLQDKVRNILKRPLDPNVPVRIYAIPDEVDRLFNDRPDPEYEDEVEVLVVVPPPAQAPAPPARALPRRRRMPRSSFRSVDEGYDDDDDEDDEFPASSVGTADDLYEDNYLPDDDADEDDHTGTNVAVALPPAASRRNTIPTVFDYQPYPGDGEKRWTRIRGATFDVGCRLADSQEFLGLLNKMKFPNRNRFDNLGEWLYECLGRALCQMNVDALIRYWSSEEFLQRYRGMILLVKDTFGWGSETDVKAVFEFVLEQMKTIQYTENGDFGVQFLSTNTRYQACLRNIIGRFCAGKKNPVPTREDHGTEKNGIEFRVTTQNHRDILAAFHRIRNDTNGVDDDDAAEAVVEGAGFFIERGNDNDGRISNGVEVDVGSTGGHSGDGTPSSPAEAEGRHDAGVLARMTTNPPNRGDLVVIREGRADHYAMYLGDVRSRDGYELIQWQWDNSKEFVDPAGIRVPDFGSSRGRRRRHQQQLPNPDQERAREGAARENNQIDDDHYDGVADVSFEDSENENETSYDSSPSNKAVALSDVDSDFHDEFNDQSGNRKQRASTTGNEQRKSKALLEEKDAEIKYLEDKLQGQGELLIVPDDSEFDIFFIDYQNDDISEVLYRKESLIKILKSRLDGVY